MIDHSSNCLSIKQPSIDDDQLSSGNVPKNQDWHVPQPILENYQSENYPKDCLPPILREAVDEVARFVQSPYPMLASSAISAVSMACQSLFDVKRAERLEGPSGLYFLTIAESGERKSTGESFFMEAIHKYEQSEAERAKPLLQEYMAQLNAWEAKCNGMKDRIRQDAKKDLDTSNLEKKLKGLMASPPKHPRIPRLIYTDATPEALAYSLYKQWPAGGLISAEGGQILGSHGMSPNSVMRNLGMLNQLWDGKPFHSDRKTSESFILIGARLSISIQIQESALREFFTNSGQISRGMGFWARFFLVWPQSTQGNRPFVEAPQDWPKLTAFNQALTQLLNTSPTFAESGHLMPTLLSLSGDAKSRWVAYHNAIEDLLKPGNQLADVRDIASKSSDNAARLAALFQVLVDPHAKTISVEWMEAATNIAAWHLNESQRFFGQLIMDRDTQNMMQLDAWLMHYCQQHRAGAVSKSTVLQYGPHGLRKKGVLEPLFNALQSRHRIRLEKQGNMQMVVINPHLLMEACDAV